MKNISYISASAGTGKTWKLTEILSELLIEGKAKPEQVIITTFTEAAARDIKEKTKSKLYDKAKSYLDSSLEDMAQGLDQALIGTIHSICNTMLRRHWYALGLSPNPSVMSEADRDFFFNQSVPMVLEKEDMDFFNKFNRLFKINSDKSDFSWEKLVASIIEKKYAYNIESFNESINYSLSLAEKFRTTNLSTALPDKEEIDHTISKLKDNLGATDLKRLKDYEFDTIISYPRVWGIVELCLKNKDTREATQDFYNKYSRIFETEEVYALQKEFIERIFAIAERWNKVYSQYKQQNNIIDYSDMESYMFQILTDDQYNEIREEISSTYKYIFVDEFQDCSPLQVKIFDKLSELLPEGGKSYWVGDHKQIIYGWRGADPNLIQAVIDTLATTPNCCIEKPLDTSWRSLKPIVDVVNDVFVPAFSEMRPSTVILNVCPPKKEESKGKQNCVRLVELNGSNESTRVQEIAAYIKNLKDNGEVNMGDVAVLCRTNKGGIKIKEALLELGIVADISDKLAKNNSVCRLVCSVLKLISHPNDNLAMAEIAYLTHSGKDIASIIDSKLIWDVQEEHFPGTHFLDDVPLIKEIHAKREDFIKLPIEKLVECAIIGLNLHMHASVMSKADNVEATLTAIRDAASQYQSRCESLRIVESIDGFVRHITETEPPMEGDPESVHILTYHKSKGLEWKYVILTELHHKPNDTSNWEVKNYAGVHVEHTLKPKPDNLYPPMIIRLQPWILGTKKTYPKNLENKLDKGHKDSIKKENIQEAKRTMYVGMTRAKDVLIFAVQTDEKDGSVEYKTNWFKEINAQFPLSACAISQCPTFTQSVPASNEDNTLEVIDISGVPKPFQPRDIMPSTCTKTGKVARCHNWNTRLEFKPIQTITQSPNGDEKAEKLADNVIGDCIHQIFCIRKSNTSGDTKFIGKILSSYGIEPDNGLIEGIVKAWENLYDYLLKTYGPGTDKHELPFKFIDNGQIYTGNIDLIWLTEKGAVVVDYKTCQMPASEIENPVSEHYAGIYAGQLDCYGTCLTKGGYNVLDKLIYYPSIGLLERMLE